MRLWGKRRGSDDATAHYDIDLHDVRQSTVAIGDHIAIATPAGARLIRTVGSEVVPEPRLRSMPILQRPDRAEPFVGRASEIASAAQAGPGMPFQVHGPDGVGKSALLKHLAFDREPAAEGVVHANVRRRGVYDIQAQLFKSFWESEVRFTPAPEEMADYLGDRRALIVLDDVGLDRSDLEELIDGSPACTFLVGAEQQTLWSAGALRLAGLETQAALELIELRLGRSLGADERAAATAVARALEGHPQRLVEAVADVRAETTSFADLARGPTWERGHEAADAGTLSEDQHRILAVLRAAGAPLGTDRIAQFADVPDAAHALAALERDGWVRSASPRYRLARDVAFAEWSVPPQKLIHRMADWATGATPEEVADEAEAIERAVAGDADPDTRLALARAAESKLALAGMLDGWGRVLDAALRASANVHDEAYVLHQLGTRDGLIGADEAAIEYLQRALALREKIGDREGAEVTRHNLEQITGGGATDVEHDNGNGGRPGWPRPLLTAVVVLATGAGIYAVARDGDRAPPAVIVQQPERGARYAPGERVRAAYSCAAGAGAALRSCRGSVPDGTAIDTTRGQHVFRVIARDRDQRQTVVTIPYTVSGPPRPQADTTDPIVELSSPSEGAVYRTGERRTATFTCTDNRGGSGIKRCTGSVDDDEPIDTNEPIATSPGTHRFVVTAVDHAGNTTSESVTYRVEPRPRPDTTAPTISIIAPADGARFYVSDTVPAEYACDDLGGSGLATCDGPVDSGQPIDTAVVGKHTFTVTATDNAGRRATMTVIYYIRDAEG